MFDQSFIDFIGSVAPDVLALLIVFFIASKLIDNLATAVAKLSEQISETHRLIRQCSEVMASNVEILKSISSVIERIEKERRRV
jgi:uncharacterized membrane protein